MNHKIRTFSDKANPPTLQEFSFSKPTVLPSENNSRLLEKNLRIYSCFFFVNVLEEILVSFLENLCCLQAYNMRFCCFQVSRNLEKYSIQEKLSTKQIDVCVQILLWVLKYFR